ncbi:TPA: ESPR-type extended signal peptide-containing protein [Neisseria meningitidis]
MNKIYRIIWNSALNARAHTQPHQTRLRNRGDRRIGDAVVCNGSGECYR